MGLAASHEWNPASRTLERGWAVARGGDEQHYLVILHSILRDRDLDLKNQYANALRGGPEAGERFRATPIAHHVYVSDPVTGESRHWWEVYRAWQPVACETEGCIPFAEDPRHGFDDLAATRELPAHPPAFSALLAAFVAPFSPPPERVESYAARAILILCAAGVVVTALVGLRLGLEPAWALAGAALLGLASPWLPYTRSFFSESANGLALVLALWAALSGRWIAAGLAVGAAAAIKPIFALVGVAWLLERVLARDRSALVQLLASLGATGAALAAFNHFALGRVVIGGNTPFLFFQGASNAVPTLLDPEHGLLPFVPWAPLAVYGLWRGLRSRTDPSREACLRIALPLVLHLAALASYGQLGAACYGPRLWVPLLPWLAVATAFAARRAGEALRAVSLALALVAAALAIPATLYYAGAFNERPHVVLVRLLGPS